MAGAVRAAEGVCDLPGLKAVDWNPADVAQGYGSFTGLLAGFCIAGLFWLVSREGKELDPSVVVGLWASVVPLSLAALLYYEAAGGVSCRGTSYDILAPSYLLSIGASTLFFYLGELIASRLERTGDGEHEPALDHAVSFSRKVYWAVLIIASASILSLNFISLRLVGGNKWWGAGQGASIVLGFYFAATSRSGRPWQKRLPEWISGRHHHRPRGILVLCMLAFFASLTTTYGITAGTGWFYATTSGRAVMWVLFLLVLVGWRREPQEEDLSATESDAQPSPASGTS